MTDNAPDHYNEPPGIEVFQDEEYPLTTVPVEVQGIVRTDEMPTRTTFHNRILKTGEDAVLILGEDPRRKKIIMWGLTLGVGVETICVGEQQSQVQAFQGAHLAVGTVIVRYELATRDPVYARGCLVNETTGTFTGFAVSTDDVLLSWAVEQWTN